MSKADWASTLCSLWTKQTVGTDLQYSTLYIYTVHTCTVCPSYHTLPLKCSKMPKCVNERGTAWFSKWSSIFLAEWYARSWSKLDWKICRTKTEGSKVVPIDSSLLFSRWYFYLFKGTRTPKLNKTVSALKLVSGHKFMPNVSALAPISSFFFFLTKNSPCPVLSCSGVPSSGM